jgi:hypothetical protein
MWDPKTTLHVLFLMGLLKFTMPPKVVLPGLTITGLGREVVMRTTIPLQFTAKTKTS